MMLKELLAAVLIALLFSLPFTLVACRRKRKMGLLWLFLVLFGATWAGGIWIRPFGPKLWGISFLPFCMAGAVVALILSVAIPGQAPRGRHETLDMLERIEKERKMEEATLITLGLFFWVLLALLGIAIIIRYLPFW